MRAVADVFCLVLRKRPGSRLWNLAAVIGGFIASMFADTNRFQSPGHTAVVWNPLMLVQPGKVGEVSEQQSLIEIIIFPGTLRRRLDLPVVQERHHWQVRFGRTRQGRWSNKSAERVRTEAGSVNFMRLLVDEDTIVEFTNTDLSEMRAACLRHSIPPPSAPPEIASCKEGYRCECVNEDDTICNLVFRSLVGLQTQVRRAHSSASILDRAVVRLLVLIIVRT